MNTYKILRTDPLFAEEFNCWAKDSTHALQKVAKVLKKMGREFVIDDFVIFEQSGMLAFNYNERIRQV